MEDNLRKLFIVTMKPLRTSGSNGYSCDRDKKKKKSIMNITVQNQNRQHPGKLPMDK